MIDVQATAAWIGRAKRLLSRDERELLTSLPTLGYRLAKYPLDRWSGRDASAAADDVDARDAELVAWFGALVRALGDRYFRLQVEGVHNVPRSGPMLLVGNHSGGLMPLEGLFTAVAIHDAFGSERRVYGLVHDVVFHDPVLRGLAQRLGMLRAGHRGAHAAFAGGHGVLVYPGSDIDAFRPFSERFKIELGGRKGFLRLALAAGVPIVPVVATGTHEQLIVLSRGDWLARRFGSRAFLRTGVLPYVFALPWGFTQGFVPYLPLPAQTTVAFGAPIHWPELDADAALDPATLERCYREVEGKMQAMMDDLARGRRFLIGKPARRSATERASR